VSLGGDDLDVGLMTCDAVSTGRWIPTFRANTLPPSSALQDRHRHLCAVIYGCETLPLTTRVENVDNEELQDRSLTDTIRVINESEMGEICSLHGGDKCIHNFSRKT
jgi:hypothetical protein